MTFRDETPGGYVFAMSPCMGCNRMFTYNPMRVPSCVHPRTGTKEPICLECVNRVNPLRIANGLPPIVPLPGAYEACDEMELGG